MKKTWRAACPNRLCSWGLLNQTPMKTVNSRALPTIPTGQAQTRRRIPPRAEAKPKRLPTTSRHRMACPAMTSWAEKRSVNRSMTWPSVSVTEGGGAQPGHAFGGVDVLARPAEDGRPGHEDVGPGLDTGPDRLLGDAAVDLHPHLSRVTPDRL